MAKQRPVTGDDPAPADQERGLRGTAGPRRLGLRILAAVLALVAAFGMMGLIDLGTLLGTSDPRYQWPVSLDVSWGSLFTFQLAAAYAWLAVRPHRPLPAVVQLAISGGALAVGAVAGLSLEPFWIALAVAGSALLFARLLPRHPTDRPSWRPRDWRYPVLAGIGILLWTPYSLNAFAVSRSVHERYLTNGIDHWAVQGATGLAIAASVVILTLWPTARPLIRGGVALSAALIGVAMLAYPERGGATESELWAVGVVVWAVLVALTRSADDSAAERGSRAGGG